MTDDDVLSVVSEAEGKAAAGDPLGAEALLHGLQAHLSPGLGTSALRRLSDTAHRWGPESCEEWALRELLDRGDSEATLRLLDLLQARLNTPSLSDSERRTLAVECIDLGSRALAATESRDAATCASLRYSRGLRHLEMLRAGEMGHQVAAREDVGSYLDWLRGGTSLPQHANLTVLVAQAQVDFAEILLICGDLVGASKTAEDAIVALERFTVGPWLIDRAYRVWSSAMAAPRQEK